MPCKEITIDVLLGRIVWWGLTSVCAIYLKGSLIQNIESKLSSKPEHSGCLSCSPQHSPRSVNLEQQLKLCKIGWISQIWYTICFNEHVSLLDIWIPLIQSWKKPHTWDDRLIESLNCVDQYGELWGCLKTGVPYVIMIWSPVPIFGQKKVWVAPILKHSITQWVSFVKKCLNMFEQFIRQELILGYLGTQGKSLKFSHWHRHIINTKSVIPPVPLRTFVATMGQW